MFFSNLHSSWDVEHKAMCHAELLNCQCLRAQRKLWGLQASYVYTPGLSRFVFYASIKRTNAGGTLNDEVRSMEINLYHLIGQEGIHVSQLCNRVSDFFATLLYFHKRLVFVTPVLQLLYNRNWSRTTGVTKEYGFSKL